MSSLVVLDNEAVQALGDFGHPKHRRVLSQVQVVAQRKRRAVEVSVAVPTTVRVEAGWDRTAANWAFANGLRIRDETLDASQANTAAMIRRHAEVSVADAHLGAVIRTATAEQITVVTSDPVDIRTVAGDRAVTIVSI
jgi:predicted nucleic acid-binding protein